jgi:hypothetical protein
MTTPAQPRHARAEIRAFAKWLRDQGWTYQYTDSLGHTIWAHPKASGMYKLPETPAHFGVQRARRDVMRLMGQKPAGKRKGKSSAAAPRRDFALEQAQREAKARPAPRVAAAAPPPPRRVSRRLPWEGQPDGYDRGLARRATGEGLGAAVTHPRPPLPPSGRAGPPTRRPAPAQGVGRAAACTETDDPARVPPDGIGENSYRKATT